jgi:hypothetical protein
MLQVDLRGVTEIIFSEIHSVNLFLTKVLNWGSLTLTFRNINRYSLAFYKDPRIGAASPLLKSSNWASLTLTFRNINRWYSLIFTKISKEGQPHPLTFRNSNRDSLTLNNSLRSTGPVFL